MQTAFSKRITASLPAIAAAAWLTLPAAWATAQPVSPPDPHDWNQFLGQERNGISRWATGLPGAWPKGGPKEVWRATGGVGMSGIATGGWKLCTLVQNDGQQWLICLDSSTG